MNYIINILMIFFCFFLIYKNRNYKISGFRDIFIYNTLNYGDKKNIGNVGG